MELHGHAANIGPVAVIVAGVLSRCRGVLCGPVRQYGDLQQPIRERFGHSPAVHRNIRSVGLLRIWQRPNFRATEPQHHNTR